MNYFVFMGGLGNQMFQYAQFYKLNKMNSNFVADLSFYESQYEKDKQFILDEVFEGIIIPRDDNSLRRYKLLKHTKLHKLVMSERLFKNINEKNFCSNMKYDYCYFKDYWGSETYWNDNKHEIKELFRFKRIINPGMNELMRAITNKTTVSIHIRRGDYLLKENEALFGGICTLQYYEKAIAYFEARNMDVQFLVLTNDTQWVKENLDSSNMLFVSDYIVDEYPDWYDMYLMTKCDHNIIANSTFSWWGAYLNDAAEKIVVTPSRWFKNSNDTSIWPMEWIRIS